MKEMREREGEDWIWQDQRQEGKYRQKGLINRNEDKRWREK